MKKLTPTQIARLTVHFNDKNDDYEERGVYKGYSYFETDTQSFLVFANLEESISLTHTELDTSTIDEVLTKLDNGEVEFSQTLF